MCKTWSVDFLLFIRLSIFHGLHICSVTASFPYSFIPNFIPFASVFISIFCVSIYFTCISVLYFPAWTYNVQTKYFLFLSVITSPNKCSLEGSVLLSFGGSPSVTFSSEACCAVCCLKLAGVSCCFGWTLVMSYLFTFDSIIMFFSTKIQSWICFAQRVWHHSHYVFSQKFRHCWEASSASVKSVAFYDDWKLEQEKIRLSSSPVSLRSSLILSYSRPYVPSDIVHLGFLPKAFCAFHFFLSICETPHLSHHSAL